MPLFVVESNRVRAVRPKNFPSEKVLQKLFEDNLDVIFGCRFVASEFPTGERHGGRIDTLAISEDNNPVLIEYKKEPSSDLINQSLFYLSWIYDHKGDYELAAMRQLGPHVEVDWSDVRVICIAPGYKKYDLHAVSMMGANIELWQYHNFANGTLYLEPVLPAAAAKVPPRDENGKNPVMVAAGKKAAETRATGRYSVEQHLQRAGHDTRELLERLRDYILGIDESVEEAPKKLYVAYKVAHNFACLEVKKSKLVLYLKLDPSQIESPAQIVRDVSGIGHYGTGDLEVTIASEADFAVAQPLVLRAFENVGG